METIIKTAIQGGYDYHNVIMPMHSGQANFERVILDPPFWQALGKACGWDDKLLHTYAWEDNERTSTSVSGFRKEYEYHALRFHEINLTEGWEKAVEYLQELVIRN